MGSWFRFTRAAVVAIAMAAPVAALPQASAQPPASAVTPDPWPKTATRDGTTYTLYQPQIDSWDDYTLAMHAAVQVAPPGGAPPAFGVVEVTAYTLVDRPNRVVYVEGISVTKASFPSAPGNAAAWQAAIQAIASDGPSTISLARLEQAIAIEGALRRSHRTPVENPPPRIVFTERDAALVLVHGDPAWFAVPGTSLQRVVNTRPFLARGPDGRLWLHLLDGFVTATSLAGPWTVASKLPEGLAATAADLGKKGLVDLLEGPADEKTHAKPTLAAGVPLVVVATSPTEIITSNGPMDWMPIEGTQLIYVTNTTGNVFLDLAGQLYYVLVTGRWFRAGALGGPWAYVPGAQLPPDFFRIPDTSPKENVKASVPGTAQAQEAAIQAGIPHMATVYTDKVSFVPVVNGPPQLTPVPGTGLSYVFNSPQAILTASPTAWYAVQAGVWFQAPALGGPWAVATTVPAAIYAIPPSSPLYYVTFVRIYAASPGVVVVGYTPGYTGVLVTADGTIVYGTGYVYPAYVTATVWYPPPVTYGYAANPTFTPWTGFAMGFAIGWSAAHWCYAPAPYWGAMPYYYHPPVPYGGAYYGAYHGAAYGAYGGAAAWGPGGWAATSGNMYGHYGSTSYATRDSAGYNAYTGTAWSSKVGTSYNSTTGRVSAGQTAAASNAYTGGYASGSRGATYNPTTGVSAEGGKATVGNAYTGQQATVGHASVQGPGGQSAHVAQVNDQYYASKDGNVYSYNSSTGQAKQYDGSTNSWNSADKSAAATGQSVSQSRAAGDSRSASSSWGGDWGGSSSHSGGWGGGGGGSGGYDRGGSGGGGWGGGGGGGGGRSWGGGGWGGGGGGSWGGFHGGGGRR